jgi:predicted outer membrane repeat protein
VNKTLEFHCHLNATNTTDEKCVFDAQQLARHFFISNSNVTFHGIEFRNGTTDQKLSTPSPTPSLTPTPSPSSQNTIGGSLFIEFSTIVTIDCNFIRNSADTGGAIYLSQSQHHLTRCHFVQNYGINPYPYSEGGAIYLYDSNIYLTGGNSPSNATIMEDNRAHYGGVMRAVYSDITMMEGYFMIRNNHATGVSRSICTTLFLLFHQQMLLYN